MFKFSKKLGEQVHAVLQDYPRTRDSDDELVYVYVRMYHDEPDISLRRWLQLVARRELPSYASLSRTRRRLQRAHPELRGKKYDLRQAASHEAQKQLGYKV